MTKDDVKKRLNRIQSHHRLLRFFAGFIFFLVTSYLLLNTGEYTLDLFLGFLLLVSIFLIPILFLFNGQIGYKYPSTIIDIKNRYVKESATYREKKTQGIHWVGIEEIVDDILQLETNLTFFIITFFGSIIYLFSRSLLPRIVEWIPLLTYVLGFIIFGIIKNKSR